MTLANMGKRGVIVIPAKERKKAEIQEGDYVEVTTSERGLILIRKTPTLKQAQAKMAGKPHNGASWKGKPTNS